MNIANVKIKLMSRWTCFLFVVSLSASVNVFAVELQSMQLTRQAGQQVVSFGFDRSPEYEISELPNGAGILLTFKGTSLGANLIQDVPAGGSIATLGAEALGNNVRVSVGLRMPAQYTLSRSDSGFLLTLASLDGEPLDTVPAVTTLTNLSFSRVSGDRVQIDLNAGGNIPDPVVFRTVNPPRIALDFFGVVNGSGRSLHKVDIASVNSIAIAEDDERMRLVLNLANPVDYRIDRKEDGIALTVFSNPVKVSTAVDSDQLTRNATFPLKEGRQKQHQIEKVDFRRSPAGGGQILVKISDSELAVDLQEIGGEIVAVFPNTTIPAELEQRLDVTDFATPVVSIDTFADGQDVKLVISPTGQYKQSSVQSGDTLIVEVSKLTKAELEAERTDEFGYTGERLSLNFQQISVRAALTGYR